MQETWLLGSPPQFPLGGYHSLLPPACQTRQQRGDLLPSSWGPAWKKRVLVRAWGCCQAPHGGTWGAGEPDTTHLPAALLGCQASSPVKGPHSRGAGLYPKKGRFPEAGFLSQMFGSTGASWRAGVEAGVLAPPLDSQALHLSFLWPGPAVLSLQLLGKVSACHWPFRSCAG